MIVNVVFERNGAYNPNSRAYSYRTGIPVKVGDIVRVPVGMDESNAMVTEVDIPDSRVDERFIDSLKSVLRLVEKEGEQAE